MGRRRIVRSGSPLTLSLGTRVSRTTKVIGKRRKRKHVVVCCAIERLESKRGSKWNVESTPSFYGLRRAVKTKDDVESGDDGFEIVLDFSRGTPRTMSAGFHQSSECVS